jgi:hypothetical protein
MNRTIFQNFDQDQRLQALWNEGEVISQKQYYETNITLFLLDDFYVEVFFNPALNEVSSIAIQEHTQILYAYVTDLDLSEIQKLLQA